MMDKLLSDFYNDYKNIQFQYGVNDCMNFVSDWVYRVTNINYRERFPGEYTNKLSALKMLKSYGFNSPIELVDHLYDRVAPRKAKRGAICSTQSEDGPAMGVFDGSNGIFMLESGLKIVPSNQIDVFWNID